MISLDTNYLIMGLVEGSMESENLINWDEKGESFCVSSIVWYEFLCGPVATRQVEAIRMLVPNIIPFEGDLAEKAAILYNRIGRKRKLRVDCMIAATAIAAKSSLATRNHCDFEVFTDLGLELIA